MKIRNLFLFLFCFSFTNQFSSKPAANLTADILYFATPEQAVEQINTLLNDKDWYVLTMCYDLEGSGVAREELISGEFFTDSDNELDNRLIIKQPFTPGYSYLSHKQINEDKVRVSLSVEADKQEQIEGNELQYFFLRKTNLGYQILP